MTKPGSGPTSTTHLFTGRKAKEAPTVTSERISADIEAFRKTGGQIEVLGVTRSLQRIGPDADASAPPAFPAPTARPRTRR